MKPRNDDSFKKYHIWDYGMTLLCYPNLWIMATSNLIASPVTQSKRKFDAIKPVLPKGKHYLINTHMVGWIFS